MLVWDSLKPLSDIPGIEFVLSLVCLLLLKCGRFVKYDFALFCSAVHANCSLLAGTLFLNLLNHGLEFSRTHAVLDHDVMDAISVVILLRFLRVKRVSLW